MIAFQYQRITFPVSIHHVGSNCPQVRQHPHGALLPGKTVLTRFAGIVGHQHRQNFHGAQAKRPAGANFLPVGTFQRRALVVHGTGGAKGAIHRTAHLAGQRPGAANMITMFMGNQNRTELIRCQPQPPQPRLGFFHREAAINQDQGIVSQHQRGITFTATAQ